MLLREGRNLKHEKREAHAKDHFHWLYESHLNFLSRASLRNPFVFKSKHRKRRGT